MWFADRSFQRRNTIHESHEITLTRMSSSSLNFTFLYSSSSRKACRWKTQVCSFRMAVRNSQFRLRRLIRGIGKHPQSDHEHIDPLRLYCWCKRLSNTHSLGLPFAMSIFCEPTLTIDWSWFAPVSPKKYPKVCSVNGQIQICIFSHTCAHLPRRHTRTSWRQDK